MTTSRPLLRSVFFITILLTSVAIGRATDASETTVSAAPTTRIPIPISINVDFGGGSIDKLIAALGHVDGVSLSIINAGEMPDLVRVELPAFALRNVYPQMVFQAVGALLEARGFNLIPVMGPNPNSMIGIVQRRPPNPVFAGNAVNGEFFSYQLAPYLAEQSVDDIIGAIQAAWAMDPSHTPDDLRLKFHPGTKLLLVSGPVAAIYLTQNVLGQLRRQTPAKTGIPAPDKTSPAPDNR